MLDKLKNDINAKEMNNFPVNVDNNTYWISRSIAVVGFIFTREPDLEVLAVKRGPGCPDEVGKWCCPCGYLDYNETCKMACMREIWEETGLIVLPEAITFIGYDDFPSGKQNVTMRFFSIRNAYACKELTTKYSENNEVDEVKWIKASELDDYDWAFNHNELIKQILDTLKVFIYDN